jgi:hypothetical protein
MLPRGGYPRDELGASKFRPYRNIRAARKDFRVEEAADGGGAVLVADEEGLAGECPGEVAEHRRGEVLVVPVELVVGDDHAADIDLVRGKGAEGKAVYEGEGIIVGGYLLKAGVLKGKGFCEH